MNNKDINDFMAEIRQALFSGLKDSPALTTMELGEMEQRIWQSIADFLKAPAGCLVFQDESSKEIERFYSSGYPDFYWWDELDYRTGLAGSSVHSGHEILVSENITTESSYKQLNPDTVAQLTIPLRINGSIRCVIVAEYDEIHHKHFKSTTKNNEALVALQGRLELAFRGFQSTLLSLKLEQILGLLNKIAEENNDEDRLKLITSSVKNFIGATEVVILQRVGGILQHCASEGVDPRKQPIRLEVGAIEKSGYTCLVAHTQREVYCRNTKDTTRYPYYLEVVTKTKSQFTLPLMRKKELVGVLNVGSPIPFGFTEMVRKLLSLFGQHAANALHTVRMLKEQRFGISQVRHQLDEIQSKLPAIGLAVTSQRRPLAHVESVKIAIENINGLINMSTYKLDKKLTPQTFSVLQILKKIDGEIKEQLKAAEISLNLIGDPSLTSNSIAEEHLKKVLMVLIQDSIAAMAIQSKANRWIKIQQELSEQKIEGITYKHLLISIKDSGIRYVDNLAGTIEIRRAEMKGPNGMQTQNEWACDQLLSLYGGYLDIETTPAGGGLAKIWLRLP